MAAITGTTGTMSATTGADFGDSGNIALIARWSMDIRRDVHDVTTFATSGNGKAKLGGMYDATGTLEGFLDGTTPFAITAFAADKAPTAIVLTASTGRTYSFSALVSNWNVSVTAAGVNAFTATFESSGDITTA